MGSAGVVVQEKSTMPRGNNNYGADISASHEKVEKRINLAQIPPVLQQVLVQLRGHMMRTNAGIFDLNGNVWEWNDGRIVNGKI